MFKGEAAEPLSWDHAGQCGNWKKVERGHHPRQAGKVESAGVLVSKGFELESQLWH